MWKPIIYIIDLIKYQKYIKTADTISHLAKTRNPGVYQEPDLTLPERFREKFNKRKKDLSCNFR